MNFAESSGAASRGSVDQQWGYFLQKQQEYADFDVRWKVWTYFMYADFDVRWKVWTYFMYADFDVRRSSVDQQEYADFDVRWKVWTYFMYADFDVRRSSVDQQWGYFLQKNRF